MGSHFHTNSFTRAKTRSDSGKRQLGSGLLNLQIQLVKDTDKFRLNCWRTERRRFLVPVLKNNNDDVVSNVAFALHLIRKTKPYYYIASHAQLQKKRKIKELGLAFTPQVDRVTAHTLPELISVLRDRALLDWQSCYFPLKGCKSITS